MAEKPLIYSQMSAVMGEIGAIGKNRKNPQQNYNFRGIDDLYNAVNAALAKHKVLTIPVVKSLQREERQTKAGGTLIYAILTIDYVFYAEDGSSITSTLIGEAMDSGDKACNKAMSAAQKYALLQAFCIPTEEPKDTENETHEVVPKEASLPNKKQLEQYHAFVNDIKDSATVDDLKTIYTETGEAVRAGILTNEQRAQIKALLTEKKEELTHG